MPFNDTAETTGIHQRCTVSEPPKGLTATLYIVATPSSSQDFELLARVLCYEGIWPPPNRKIISGEPALRAGQPLSRGGC